MAERGRENVEGEGSYENYFRRKTNNKCQGFGRNNAKMKERGGAKGGGGLERFYIDRTSVSGCSAKRKSMS